MSTRHTSTENGGNIPRGVLRDPIGKPSILSARSQPSRPCSKIPPFCPKHVPTHAQNALPLPLKLFTVNSVFSIGPAIQAL